MLRLPGGEGGKGRRGAPAAIGRGTRLGTLPRASSVPHTALSTRDTAVNEGLVCPCSWELLLQQEVTP